MTILEQVVPLSEIKCRGCGSLGPFAPKLEILTQCLACELVFWPKQVTAAEVEAIYNQSYYNGGAYFDYLGDRHVLEKTFRNKLRVLEPYFRQTDSVYEIGCAHGFFINLLRESHAIGGIDVSLAALYARDELKLPVVRGDFLQADIPAGRYGMFCMWDTIEHLVEPGAYIHKIADLLPPGGHLAITTGDIGSLVARLQGQAWRLIEPPAHLSYFSRRTITTLLTTHGLRPVLVRSLGTYRSLRQIIAGLARHRSNWTPLNGLLSKLPSSLSFYLDLGDIMLVVAKKPGLADG